MKPNEIAGIVMTLVLFGWIPILAIGSVVSKCIRAKKCSKCIYHNYNNENPHKNKYLEAWKNTSDKDKKIIQDILEEN